jgi:hypothetical protein
MAKYRVEVTETVTIVREVWVTADSEDDAISAATDIDIKNWKELWSHADCDSIVATVNPPATIVRVK